MRKLLVLALSAGVLAYILSPQWRSFDRMGERRFRALRHRPKEILVGVFWPFAVNQDGMADGLQLAREEINAGGLARGIPVRLVLRNDDFDWEKAKQIAIEFSGTPDMSAMLGYYDDSEAIKASMMYESSRLLHVIVGANNTAMTGRGLKYIVRTILSSDKIARALAKLAVDSGHRKFAMIFFAGLEPLAGDFLRMARAVGVKTDIVGAFSDTPEMRARAGAGEEGAMYFDLYDRDSPSPENQAFVRKFRARYARNPDTWAAQGYDALRILAKAVQATGSANPLDLSYAIRFMDPWEGANGRYKFDERGELDDKRLFLKVYRNGTPVIFQESLPVPGPLIR